MLQVSEEIKGRVKKKLNQEFSRTERRILGAQSKLDEVFLRPLIWTLTRNVPGTSPNNDFEIPEPTEDHSQSVPYPKVEFSAYRTTSSVDCDSEETSSVVTRVQLEIPSYSAGTSSEKQKKAPSTS